MGGVSLDNLPRSGEFRKADCCKMTERNAQLSPSRDRVSPSYRQAPWNPGW